mmetsp:Transcript_36659/g.6562  ORF Transcript_36659/g.6562 Transcript_36659/m.6562 type:complete len:102 (-) Transcript_36659:44-349(-)|eukprot:CAMPEP_0168316468 /NCGR_PEP_ID=MMETSP0210-20121227/15628_1 /TAXON_ID=40633 /ORGANISM="Condylostoma magnum, Strain COL2" /LENGTH=101 /DNA_ID=CAMNT_0008297369 /DNA_START=139 /DNA_END=444 /DNA_ORIENTATION=+
MDEIKRQADPNDSGIVDFPTFLTVYGNNLRDPISEQEIIKAFEELDENKRGQISVKKLKHLMSSCAEIMDEEEIEKMLHYAQPDQEGNVNYREFVRTMMAK